MPKTVFDHISKLLKVAKSRNFNPLKGASEFKVIPLKLVYYKTFLKLGVINIDDVNIKKIQ